MVLYQGGKQMKQTIQKTIIFNKSEMIELEAGFNLIQYLDGFEGITFHKFIKLMSQFGIDYLRDTLEAKSIERFSNG